MYPILFEFSIITVFSLWLLVTVGFVVGAVIFRRLCRRQRVHADLIGDHTIGLFVWTLIISRIIFIFTHLDLYFYQFQFKSLLHFFEIWDKGFSFWGAVAAWAVGMIFIARQNNDETSALRLFDLLIPSVFIGMFFGNIGTFLDGINYGSPTTLPWGVIFRSATVKYISPIHPTQLYSAVYCLASGLFLLFVVGKLRGRLVGFTSELGIFIFSFFKFFEEFFRGDEALKIGAMRIPQLIALFGIMAGLFMLHRRYTNAAGGDPERLLRRKMKPGSATTLERMSSLQNQGISAAHHAGS